MAAIGDVAEAKIMKLKKTYGYARLTRLITPSPDRIAARCPVARQCGGCQIQAMSYPAQLRFKEAKVREQSGPASGRLEHPPMEPIIGYGGTVPLPEQSAVPGWNRRRMGVSLPDFMPDGHMRLSSVRTARLVWRKIGLFWIWCWSI
ncbi:MAG: hypothetical protein ACLTSZ_14880 [Lachnospiraceae bacterium]